MKKLLAFILLISFFSLAGCTSFNQGNKEEKKIQIKATLKQVLDNKKISFCEFSFEDDSTKEVGILYLQEGKLQSTTKTEFKNENLSMDTKIIIKDGFVYTRNSLQENQGTKFQVLDKKNTQQYTEDPIDNKELDLTCEWTEVDTEIFKLPPNISFVDITEYLFDK